MPDPVVVLIEDEPQIRRFLRATLTGQGYRLFEATTGADGLVEVGSRQPDVVIVDLGLPDVDGIDVIRRLREWTAVPIIVLSARGQERDKVTALDAGADDYVSKPFGASELLAQPLGELGLPGLGETLADHRALPREDCAQLDRLRADRRPVEAQQLFGLSLVEVFRVDLDQLLLEQRAGEDAHERAADHVDQLLFLLGRQDRKSVV